MSPAHSVELLYLDAVRVEELVSDLDGPRVRFHSASIPGLLQELATGRALSDTSGRGVARLLAFAKVAREGRAPSSTCRMTSDKKNLGLPSRTHPGAEAAKGPRHSCRPKSPSMIVARLRRELTRMRSSSLGSSGSSLSPSSLAEALWDDPVTEHCRVRTLSLHRCASRYVQAAVCELCNFTDVPAGMCRITRASLAGGRVGAFGCTSAPQH